MLPSYLRINVTQTHIDYGEAVDCELCPIALAIQDAFIDLGVTERIRVTVDSAWMKDGREFQLPREAQIFIMDFDQGNPVEPFNFLLSL